MGGLAMHELSIALSILDIAAEEAERRGGVGVAAIHLKLGASVASSRERFSRRTRWHVRNRHSPPPVWSSRMSRSWSSAPPAGPKDRSNRSSGSLPRMWHLHGGDCRWPGTGNRRHGDSPMSTLTRLVQVRQQVLKSNDVTARLRKRFEQAGVYVVSLVSSPGSGKTSLLRKTLCRPPARAVKIAALVGDLATENDARRLAEAGVPVRQILTGTVCHLEAAMVAKALGEWDIAALDFLSSKTWAISFVPPHTISAKTCALSWFSTTEGEDKPLKYPTIFNTADLAMITKSDLADAVQFDRPAAHAAIQSVRPGMPIMETSARTAAGLSEWIQCLERHRNLKRGTLNLTEVEK